MVFLLELFSYIRGIVNHEIKEWLPKGKTRVFLLTSSHVDIGLMRLPRQLIQPADLHLQIGPLHVADGVPDTGQPVRDQGERGHEQQQDGRTVLRVAVQFAGHSHQSQEAGRL